MLKAQLRPVPSGASAADRFSSEQDLLEGLRRGDETAAREFYDRYAQRIYRFIFQVLAAASVADAEDLLQETMMALAEALPYFRGDCSLFTFACAIARRKVASFVRSSSRGARLDLVAAAEPAPGPDSADDAPEIAAALAGLSRDYREVLILKYVEELTVGEIAAILSLSEHAAESRLARARRALARGLGVTR